MKDILTCTELTIAFISINFGIYTFSALINKLQTNFKSKAAEKIYTPLVLHKDDKFLFKKVGEDFSPPNSKI